MQQSQNDLIRIRNFLDQSETSPNGRLPAERELADILGLTRSRLRTGLRKLAAEGAISRHVGRGTFVGKSAIIPLIPSGQSLQDLTNPREVMTARLTIEPTMSRLAALNATGRDLLQIRKFSNEMKTARDWNSWDRLDARLHRAIAQAAGNALLLLIFDTVQASRNKEIWGRLREPVDPASAIETATHDHSVIVQALQDRDANAAERAMREHLRAIEKRVFGSMG